MNAVTRPMLDLFAQITPLQWALVGISVFVGWAIVCSLLGIFKSDAPFEHFKARLSYFPRWLTFKVYSTLLKTVLSRVGNTIFSLFILLWLACEHSHKIDLLKTTFPNMREALIWITAGFFVIHIVKIALDLLEARSSSIDVFKKEKLLGQLAELADVFLQDLEKAREGYVQEVFAQRAAEMVLPLANGSGKMAREGDKLAVMMFYLSRNSGDDTVLYEPAATNDGAREVFGEKHLADLAADLSTRSFGGQKRRHFNYALVRKRRGNKKEASYREGCVVLEDLGVEPYMAEGRPLVDTPQGSCVVYTIGLFDGTRGAAIIVTAANRGAFRNASKSDYAVPLKACAVNLLSMDKRLKGVMPLPPEARQKDENLNT